jgi:cholesterol transport system auxiliary component
MTLVLGCGALLPKSAQSPSFHSLDNVSTGAAQAAPPGTDASAATLLISPPHAAPGFDSRHMIYTREAHKLEYFAHNEWIDTPARMLAPLIASTLARSARFRAIVLMPSAATGDISLDTGIVRLEQEFDSDKTAGSPSRVRFTLSATLVDRATHRVIAAREFDSSVAAGSDDPAGGVLAANQAVQIVLNQLSLFCGEAARDWKAPTNRPGQ